MKLTVADLQHVLDTYDKGVLSPGSHNPADGAYCALEAVSLARNNGRENFSDDPMTLGMPDLRRINDARWSSDQARTTALLPLIAALSDWSLWSASRQQKWASIVALETVRQVVSELPRLTDAIRNKCRQASTLKEAQEAAEAAAWGAAEAAAWGAAEAAAWAAAGAARAAAEAAAAAAARAAEAASDKVLLTVVAIWLSAVEQSHD